MDECSQALGETEGYLRDCVNQLKVVSGSFGEVVKGMKMVLKRLKDDVAKMERNLCATAGLVVGGVAGTAVLPVIGMAIGAAVGWGVGKVINVARGEKIDQEKLQREIEMKKRTLTNCRVTEKSANLELEELMRISSKSIIPAWIPAWNIQYGRNAAYY